MVRQYDGKVAIITGAASGLGRALAKELAGRRCHLALVDIDAPRLAETKQELSRPGIVVSAHCSDVGLEQDLERAAAEIEGMHGTVHLLINNAAVSASASFLNTSSGHFDHVMRVNFCGVVYCCRIFLPLLLRHGEGQILNISSCFAWVGYPRKTAYASSKAAIRAFSESLRWEIADYGVGVTVLYPGPLNTSIVRNGFSDSADSQEREQEFLRSRGLPLGAVAKRSLDRLRTNPSRIVIGADYRLMDLLGRLSPGLASRVTQFTSRRFGF